MRTISRRIAAGSAVLVFIAALSFAQQQPPPPPPPPMMPPGQLDQLVSRIALYPDPLLAQVLAAATYYDQIPEAARWADQHGYLHGDALANAITEDQLPWDPSVLALLPFPSVLDMMARDPGWTSQVGNAFLAQQQDVMDAVQRERHRAYDYGYLRTNPQFVVTPGPYIAIAPVNPGFYYVPLYDPLVVFAAPRPGFFIGGAIRFGGGITIGAAFAPWGWGRASFVWPSHGVIINGRPWARTYATRQTYVHPYTVQRYAPERRVEHHELHGREEERRR
jgi:uncharacterized protein DUF3300